MGEVFGIPHLPPIVTAKDVSLEITGSKPAPIEPYYSASYQGLPHISQKSLRPQPTQKQHLMPRASKNTLEAIHIYKHAKAEKSPRHHPEAAVTSPPKVPNASPTPEHLQGSDRLAPLNTKHVHAGNISNQDPDSHKESRSLLTKLANKKKSTDKKALMPPLMLQVEPKNKNVLPAIPSKRSPHETKKRLTNTPVSTRRNKIQEQKVSFQLLEIPAVLSKPKKGKQICLPNIDYDDYQHQKFSNSMSQHSDTNNEILTDNKKLSIVAGPEGKAVWDFDKFLYLNIKT